MTRLDTEQYPMSFESLVDLYDNTGRQLVHKGKIYHMAYKWESTIAIWINNNIYTFSSKIGGNILECSSFTHKFRRISLLESIFIKDKS